MDKYFEIKITPSLFKDEIENFLIERFFNGIEEKENTLILRSEEPLDDLIDELKNYTNALEKIFNKKIDLKIEVSQKENKDWIENYKKSIKPIEIDNIYIHPTWESPKEDKLNIVIDPALAFGTGHHETTRSCIKAIKKYVKSDDKVLDLGCGSGILGIVANKLGAKVSACDTDVLAVDAAKKNFRLNNAEYEKLWEGSIDKADEKYDVIIANIIADVLIFLANDIKKRAKLIILSGIIDKYRDRVLEKYKDFELIEEIKDKEWVTFVLKDKNGK
jgi:ribosomal protein L11 methyltransferase